MCCLGLEQWNIVFSVVTIFWAPIAVCFINEVADYFVKLTLTNREWRQYCHNTPWVKRKLLVGTSVLNGKVSKTLIACRLYLYIDMLMYMVSIFLVITNFFSNLNFLGGIMIMIFGVFVLYLILSLVFYFWFYYHTTAWNVLTPQWVTRWLSGKVLPPLPTLNFSLKRKRKKK